LDSYIEVVFFELLFSQCYLSMSIRKHYILVYRNTENQEWSQLPK